MPSTEYLILDVVCCVLNAEYGIFHMGCCVLNAEYGNFECENSTNVRNNLLVTNFLNINSLYHKFLISLYQKII